MDPVSRAFENDHSLAVVPKSTGSSVSTLRPFKPGVSGNPLGRKKKGAYTKMCERMAKSKKGRELLRATMIAILEKQGMAAVLLMREIGERADGKVAQELDVSGSIITMSEEDLNKKLQKLIA